MKKETIIPILLIVLVLGLGVSWSFGWIKIPILESGKVDENEQLIESNQLKIDSLRTVINNLQTNQKVYDSTFVRLKDSISVISTQLTVNQSKIKDLRKKYNEKVDNVSGYSSDQLEEFLSGRYK